MGILNRTDAEQATLPQDSGLIPRSFHHIFRAVEERKDAGEIKDYAIFVSFLQIYNDTIVDLLPDPNNNAGDDGNVKLTVYRDKEANRFFVENLYQYQVSTVGQALDRLNQGLGRITRASTRMNATSSRSHTIMTITLEQTTAEDTQLCSDLMLVDLAGSERNKKNKTQGARQREASHINTSLSYLGNVIEALVDGQSHVPYWVCKLTKVLAHGLGGNSKTVLVATVGPAAFNSDETRSTLMFAKRCARVRNEADIMEEVPVEERLRRLEAENAALKAQIAAGGHVVGAPAVGGGTRMAFDILTSIHTRLFDVVQADRARLTTLASQKDDLIREYAASVTAAIEEARVMATLDPSGDPHMAGLASPAGQPDALQRAYMAMEAHVPPVPHAKPGLGMVHPIPTDFDSPESMRGYMQQLDQWIAGLIDVVVSLLSDKDDRFIEFIDNSAAELARIETSESEVANWTKILNTLLATNTELKARLAGRLS